MNRPRLGPSLDFLVGASLAVVLLYACQDTTSMTELDGKASLVTRTVTIIGSGSGDGTVKSSPAGINCTVSNGTAGTTGCKAQFTQGTSVTLTATPKPGHSFKGWFRTCTGTGTCSTTMSVNRTVDARFLEGPFKIRISGGVGTGSGKVTSQAGLSPAINCVITDGTPAATGCSANYPAYTDLVLTATPSAGNAFTWGPPCSGAGICQHTVTQPRTLSAVFSPSGTSASATRGEWGPTYQTPVVGIHMHMLPTGKVLLWGERGAAQLWDPGHPGAGFIPVNKTFQIFCSGHTFLADGRLLIAGGTISGTKGDARAVIFDPATSTWSPTSSMAQGRYYPTLTVMANGKVVAVSGNDQNGNVVSIPEINESGTWRRLTGASLTIANPFYPPMFVAPNGKVFLAGFLPTSAYLDVAGTGHWTAVAKRKVAGRMLGSAVMYAPGKVLYAGGGVDSVFSRDTTRTPTNAVEVIDLNQSSPAWRAVSSMAFARRQLNATIVADGSVLVTGGTSGTGFNNQGAAVHAAELWNPTTESWTTMASETHNRTYHSTAVLLPSGKVLSSGSGEGGGILFQNSEFSAQLFSPPYLFKADGSLAPRPSITSVPGRISYGKTFTIQTPTPASISRGTLIRLSSVTHGFNQSQRLFPLTVRATGSTTLSAVAPARGALAPPGPYMLFLINSAGVPSIAKIVMVGP